MLAFVFLALLAAAGGASARELQQGRYSRHGGGACIRRRPALPVSP